MMGNGQILGPPPPRAMLHTHTPIAPFRPPSNLLAFPCPEIAPHWPNSRSVGLTYLVILVALLGYH